MKLCPYCAEQIQESAIKCRYCKSDLIEPGPHEATSMDIVSPVLVPPQMKQDPPGELGPIPLVTDSDKDEHVTAGSRLDQEEDSRSDEASVRRHPDPEGHTPGVNQTPADLTYPSPLQSADTTAARGPFFGPTAETAMEAPSAARARKCPACAETIKSEAIVCRFCGFDFRTLSIPTAGTTQASPTRANGLAIASLVLGIVWVYGVGSILALVFGYLAKGQIDQSAGRETGRGMAIAGIVLGWVGVGLILLFIIIGIAAMQ